MNVGLAAGDRAHRAPNAERALAGRVFARPLRAVQVRTAVDRFANERDRTVGAQRVDAARVMARRAHVTPTPTRVRNVGRAGRRVRRENRRNAQNTRTTVGVQFAARFRSVFAVQRRAVVGSHHRQAGRRGTAAELNDTALDAVGAGAVARRRFDDRDRVRGTVGDRRKRVALDAAVNARTRADAAREEAAFVDGNFAGFDRRVADRTGVTGALSVVDVRFRRPGGVARATEHRNRRLQSRDRAVPSVAPTAKAVRFVAARDNLLPTRALLDERVHRDIETDATPSRRQIALVVARRGAHRRERVVRVVIVLQPEPDLFQVVRALHTARRFARRLNRRKKKTDQNTDNGDNDEKFDKRKTAFTLFAPPPPD